MGLGMGILGVRGVQEKVGAWREWGGGMCDLGYVSHPPTLGLVLPRVGGCPETWLLLSLQLVDLPYQVDGNRSGQGWGGVDGNICTLPEESGASDHEVYRAEH